MTDAFGLLEVDKNLLNDYYLQARWIDNLQLEKVVQKNIVELKRIQNRLFNCEKVEFESHSVDEVINKVKTAVSDVNSIPDLWTGRELRILSYYIVKLQQDMSAYKFALSLLDSKWKDLYINGLVLCVMTSWNELKANFRKEVCLLIVSKLQNYTGNNTRYGKMKSHADYFEEVGPIRMSALLKKNGTKVLDAPSILGMKQISLSQSYYSDVIVNYYKREFPVLSELVEVFQVHSNPRTKKLLFAELVELLDAEGTEYQQELLSKFIEGQLGNISINATWAPFLGATEEDCIKLKKAQKLVQIWLTRRIIDTFFEICVQDLSRKKFWLQYVQYVDKFKVIGSQTTKHLLESDPRIDSLNGSFIKTNSRVSQNSALVLCMGDSVIVEFSAVGALYVYKKTNEKVHFLISGDTSISSIEELKSPSMVTNNYLSKGELRMVHIGGWEYRLDYWLKNNILCNLKDQSSNDGYQESKSNILICEGLTIRCKSKLIFGGKSHVVGCDEGFYLECNNSVYFLCFPKVCLDDCFESRSSIWIKKMENEEWLQVILYMNNTEYPICCLQRDGIGRVYCKTEFDQRERFITKIN